MVRKLVFFSAFLLIASSASIASTENRLTTGYDLYKAIQSWENPQNNIDRIIGIQALEYVRGFFDGISLMQDSLYERVIPGKLMSERARAERAEQLNFGRLNIPKDGLPTGQCMMIFQKWAKNHPEYLDSSARMCLFFSFIDTYGWK
jgi:hypothetical protein